MPHDPYAELIARLREHPAFMIGGPAADAAMIALLQEAATAMARLSAPVTEEEVEAAYVEFERVYGLAKTDQSAMSAALRKFIHSRQSVAL